MIISKEEIILSESQEKFLESGWGKEVKEGTIVNKITYDSDGFVLTGYLAYPKSIEKSEIKLPLIIWNRGGYRNDGKIDEFLARGIFGEIASWGYVVLASQYREEDEFGGQEINDILNLLPLAEEISFCDSEIIGMEGWSRGGMMAYKVLCKTDRIKCAVIISGLSDLFRSIENKSSQEKIYRDLFGSNNADDENDFAKKLKDRSAVYFADKINKSTNILLIHGTADDRVSHEDSLDMFELLKQNGINSELRLIENGDHYLRRNRKETLSLRREWFRKYLNK